MALGRTERRALVLLTAYTVAAGFTRIPHVEVHRLGASPEIAFLVLGVLGIALFGGTVFAAVRERRRPRPGPLDFAVLAWFTVALASALVHHVGDEGAAALYLAAVYVAVRALLSLLPAERRLEIATDAFTVMGVVHALLGIAGWLLSATLHDDRLTSWSTDRYYPLTGYLGRASGVTTTPNMLAALLAVPCILVAARVADGRSRRYDRLALATMSAGLVVTFSKSLLVVAIALCYLVASRRPVGDARRRASWACGVTCFAVLLVSTHVWVHRVGDPHVAAMRGQAIASSVEVGRLGDWVADQMSYTQRKIAAVRLGWRNPLLGVGPGRFDEREAELRAEGTLDPGLGDDDPHSTYTGTFAELGVPGLAALGALLAAAHRAARDRATRALVLAFAIEAISTDIMHFRFWWVALAVIAASTAGEGPASRPPSADGDGSRVRTGV